MEALGDRIRARGPQRTPEQLEREAQRESLELSRQRVIHDLEQTVHPRRQEQLRAALAHLDKQLKDPKLLANLLFFDTEVMLYLILVIAGVLFVIAVMVFVSNPPEAWVKKAFHKKRTGPRDLPK